MMCFISKLNLLVRASPDKVAFFGQILNFNNRFHKNKGDASFFKAYLTVLIRSIICALAKASYF
jgi:hypothetical protein